MGIVAKISKNEQRLNELIENIEAQEELFDLGSKKLLALNAEYDSLNEKVHALSIEKGKLAHEISVMASNLALFK